MFRVWLIHQFCLIALWLEVVLGQVGVAIVPCNVVIHRSIEVWAQHRAYECQQPIVGQVHFFSTRYKKRRHGRFS